MAPHRLLKIGVGNYQGLPGAPVANTASKISTGVRIFWRYWHVITGTSTDNKKYG